MSFEVSLAVMPLVATSITFTTVAFILVVARIYTRVMMLKNAGVEDWIMLAAMVVSVAFCATAFYQIRYGLGKPFVTIPLHEREKFYQCLWATIPVYNLSLTLTKISIVFQYRRIFTTPRVRKLCNIMVAVFIVYGCWTVLGSVFMCIPVAYFWDTTLEGHCMNKLGFWFSNAALNIATDIMLFASPIPRLVQLQLPKKEKIGLIFIFGFGAFVCVTSIIRLKSLHEISVATDTSFEGVSIAIWSGIEINVAISCASLPTLKPLISKILPRLLSNLSSRNRSDVYSIPGHRLDSHQMNTLHIKSKTATRVDEIQVEQNVYQSREARLNGEGSETNLVSWEADCYSEEQGGKQGV